MVKKQVKILSTCKDKEKHFTKAIKMKVFF